MVSMLVSNITGRLHTSRYSRCLSVRSGIKYMYIDISRPSSVCICHYSADLIITSIGRVFEDTC